MSSEESQAEQSTQSESQASPSRICAQCGVEARRPEARFCSACGRSLDESYLPADALRASYSSHHRRVLSRSSGKSVKPVKSSMSLSLYPKNRNGASTTAMAFVTYSLVPYLGILFCPGAVVMGGVGLFNSYSAPERGGRRTSYLGITLGVLIFCAQFFLWWILYKIPQWNRM
ncbi:MAG TPA: hypothetical protein VF779_02670 [Pyrinomonadaceae bacterium]